MSGTFAAPPNVGEDNSLRSAAGSLYGSDPYHAAYTTNHANIRSLTTKAGCRVAAILVTCLPA